MKAKKTTALSILLYILVGLVWVLGVAMLEGAAHYAVAYSQVSFAELLFTLTAPMQGTSTEFAHMVFQWVGIPALKALAAYIVVCLLLSPNRWTLAFARKLRLVTEKYDLLVWLRRLGVLFVAFVFALGCRRGFWALKIGDYLKEIRGKSTIYEEEYIDPQKVTISLEGKPRNLVLLYLESMEVAYADTEHGGLQQGVNYMPQLTALAEENISFSTGDQMNGHHTVSHATWTTGALMASSAGVSYNFPLEYDILDNIKSFAPGLISLGDILGARGYRQTFLCGSDATFGGRRTYYSQHGHNTIFDVYEAIDRGLMTRDDIVWWGFQDTRLYEYARMELTDMAAGDQPFCLTMLTVDLHHPDGYICEICQEKYPEITANVCLCSDHQAADFIDWLREQDFYEDTTIVILGDHPRMDANLVNDVPVLERGVYNCFINPVATPVSTSNRNATTMDMFPTIMAAMGFHIEGERLGLGTNLFSDTPTLADRRGLDWINDQLARYSTWFLEHFENVYN